MIVGIGIDLVSIDRVRAILTRHGERARRRLFTSLELADCDVRADVYSCLAARVAAKEAALKALGTGVGPGDRWTDAAVIRSISGCPELAFSGKPAERAKDMGVARVWVSLSHEAGIACAMVVLEGEEEQQEEEEEA